MKLGKYQGASGHEAVGLISEETLTPLDLARGGCRTLADLLEVEAPRRLIEELADPDAASPLSDVAILAPIDRQEVWAAGVTYRRSRRARMEESESSASCYDRVYESPRPELFFKASPHRVAGPGQPVRIRRDSQWNVPEPELTLVLNSRLRLAGFTIGNDMSSRDIEGQNPLYLPQAKVYNACCGLGPWITLAEDMPAVDAIGIELVVRRGGGLVYNGRTSGAEMARSLADLIEYLGRDNSFPDGAFLLTGAGIVPDRDFTLQGGDLVEITIDGIGCLTNPVVQG